MFLERLTLTMQQRGELTGPFRKAVAASFPQQQALILSTAKRQSVCCGRRAGKTNGIALWLYGGGLTDPGGLSLYVGRTQYLARITLMPKLVELKAAYGLEFRERMRDNQLQVLLPNGHVIWLSGCKDSAEYGKFRGPKFRRVAWDEASLAGPWLGDAIEDAIDPALSDTDGEFILAGTPGYSPIGYWFEAANGKRPGWIGHHWTCLENPYWRQRQGDGLQYLADKRAINRWTEQHPTYLREWLGLWVDDPDAKVFHYDYGRNSGWPPPDGRRQTVIAIDLGDTSPTAWVVLQTVPPFPEIYVVECQQRPGLIPSAVAAHTANLLQRYPGARVVVDTGGLGGAYAREMQERFGISAEPADKRDRRSAIEMVRGDVLSGIIKLDPQACRPIVDEWSALQWDEKHENFDARFADHLTDAVIYGHRMVRPLYRPEIEPDNSPDAMMARYKAQRQREVAKRLAEQMRVGRRRAR